MFPDVYDFEQANEMARQSERQQQRLRPLDDVWMYFQEYAREKPEVTAIWCFGIGFVLGWKLKPW